MSNINLPPAIWDLHTTDDRLISVEVPWAVTDRSVNKLLITGWGETNVEEIAFGLGRQGIKGLAVCNVVYPADPENPDLLKSYKLMEKVIVDGIDAVTCAISDLNDSEEAIWGIGNSKGGGEMITAALHQPGIWSEVVPVAPLGVINPDRFGADHKERRRTISRRIKAAGLVPPDQVNGNGLQAYREFSDGLEHAFKHDGAKMAKHLHDQDKILKYILVGEDDVIFPVEDYRSTLRLSVPVKVIKGMGHISLLTNDGIGHMAGIIKKYASPEPLEAAVA